MACETVTISSQSDTRKKPARTQRKHPNAPTAPRGQIMLEACKVAGRRGAESAWYSAHQRVGTAAREGTRYRGPLSALTMDRAASPPMLDASLSGRWRRREQRPADNRRKLDERAAGGRRRKGLALLPLLTCEGVCSPNSALCVAYSRRRDLILSESVMRIVRSANRACESWSEARPA